MNEVKSLAVTPVRNEPNINSSDDTVKHDKQDPLAIDDEDDDDSWSKSSIEAFERDRDQVLALGSELRVDFRDLEGRKGGFNNRVITLTMHNSPDEAGTKAILRLPRLDEPRSPGDDAAEHAITQSDKTHATEDPENPYSWFENALSDNPAPESDHLEILDGVAVLKLLARSSIPVPQVLAFDVTRDNALRSPYALHTRLPGKTLGDVWKDMPTDDKINIAGELATILADLDTIRFPQSGRLLHEETTTTAQSPLDLFKSGEVGKNVVVSGFFRGSGIVETRDKPTVPTSSSLYDLLSTHIDDKVQYAKFRAPYELEDFEKLQHMLQDMKEMNWFATGDGSEEYSIVNHNDYDPRNIIVEHTEGTDGSSGWHISGIVDWDDAHCVPPVLTRRPPLWLFDFNDDDVPDAVWKYYVLDYDMMPLEYYREINPDHFTVDTANIKKRFEQVMVDRIYAPRYGARAMEVYQDDTYGRGRWLRRVWRFAQEGIFDASHDHRLEQVLKEWEEFKQTGQVSHLTVFGEEDHPTSNALNLTTTDDQNPSEAFKPKVSTPGADIGFASSDIGKGSQSEPTSNNQEVTAESKVDTHAESNDSQGDKLHLAIPGLSIADSPAKDTAGNPEQKSLRSKISSTFLNLFKRNP